MHIQTRRQLEHLLTMLAEEGEEKTFAYVRRILKKAVGQTDIVPDVQPGGQTQNQKGLHTVISDLFETGENDERFLLAGIADVLQLSESDGLRKLERKKRRRR